LLWNLDEGKIIRESFETSLLAVKIIAHIKHNKYKNKSTSSLIVAITKFKGLLYSNILYYNWANTEIRFNNWQEIGKGKFQDIDMDGNILYQQKSAEMIVYNPFIEKKIFKNFLTKCHHQYSCGDGHFNEYGTVITYLCKRCSRLTISRCKYTNISDKNDKKNTYHTIGSVIDSAWKEDFNCSNFQSKINSIVTFCGKNKDIVHFQYDEHSDEQ